MSGRTRCTISATARARALSPVARSRRSLPSVSRLRLLLKVAMRTSPAGRSAAVAGKLPATATIDSARTRRTSTRRSEVEAQRSDRGARRADGIERHRAATGAGADVAEVFLVEQVRHVELELHALELRNLESIGQVEIDHRI